MPRMSHGTTLTDDSIVEVFRQLSRNISPASAMLLSAFPAQIEDFSRFDFMFPGLQQNSSNLLEESSDSVARLVSLGLAMRDTGTGGPGGSGIPAVFTYLGQFIDHDITLEMFSEDLVESGRVNLDNPDLVPLPLTDIASGIRNVRTATLDLDSVYQGEAKRDGDMMAIDDVVLLNETDLPLKRPPTKNDNDLPRREKNDNPELDRAALIGDPRNDENLIIAQLHLAFLKAHNEIVKSGESFDQARTILRQHYQHIVLTDFLPRIVDMDILNRILRGDPSLPSPFTQGVFMPLEFSVAAYRFGHSMVRRVYDFNINFNSSGDEGTVLGTFDLAFTFTALTGQLGNFDNLPENWIIQWENLVDGQPNANNAASIDTKLIEPLFELRNIVGEVEASDIMKNLAVRNLLRGYLLRVPTGQAVSRALGFTPLTPDQLRTAAKNADQVKALEDGGFLERTPLWYYVLAEASLESGEHLGPVGSVIVASTIVGLVGSSTDSILAAPAWRPSLPSREQNLFELVDLLMFAGVL